MSLKLDKHYPESLCLEPELYEQGYFLREDIERLCLNELGKAKRDIEPELEVKVSISYPGCVSVDVYNSPSLTPYASLSLCVNDSPNEFYFDTPDFKKPNETSSLYCPKTTNLIESLMKSMNGSQKKIKQKLFEHMAISNKLYQAYVSPSLKALN